ncbi:uncharacterized protein LOC122956257 [Acropora millepora]|uniref:uncharacterized protein LOC122956257 n=1 Tax=Acropora millepora TaxID=45264 RepID=UPI001CF0F449|nr:uncharacterized protein LOC122956257 [Acropora millepora]
MNSKRKARNSSDSSTCGSSPVEKRAREILSSSNSSPERLVVGNSEVVEVVENLESKVDLILARLETMDKKLENINTAVSNLESKFNKLEDKVVKLEDAQSTTRNTFREMEDSLQEFNTRVNEAKATGEKIKELCVNKCKELENKLLYAEVYQRRKNLRFYGIEETDGNENSLKVLQSFLERQCGIEPGIEFQRVHRIGNPRRDGSPRAIIARFQRYGDRELIFSNAKKLKDTEYRISTDLPKEIVHRRKRQSKKLVEARKAGKTAFFSRAEPDKLFIDGVLNSI